MYKKFIFLYLTYEINTIKDFFAFEILRLFEKSNYLKDIIYVEQWDKLLIIRKRGESRDLSTR